MTEARDDLRHLVLERAEHRGQARVAEHRRAEPTDCSARPVIAHFEQRLADVLGSRLAAPLAGAYDPHIGMTQYDSCWILPRRP